MFPVSCHIEARILFHISERLFHISSSNNVCAADQISASLSRGGRCNVSTALLAAACHPPFRVLIMFPFFSFFVVDSHLHLYLVSRVSAPECVTPLSGPLKAHCVAPQMSVRPKKKEKGAFCSQFGFHPAALIGTISRSGGLLYFKSWRTNGRESVFIVSTCPGLGSSEISGEERRILGRARIRPPLSG